MAYPEKPTTNVDSAQLGQAKTQDVAQKPTIQQIYRQDKTQAIKKKPASVPSPPISGQSKVKRPAAVKNVSGTPGKSVAAEPRGLARSGWDYDKSTGKYVVSQERKRQLGHLHKRYLDWRKRMGRRTSPGQTAVANKPTVASLKYPQA